MVREILVVKRDTLFENGFFTGFAPVEEGNFLETIKNNCEWKERNDELEHNLDYKQVVSYVWILNTKTRKIFAYKRAPSDTYTEKRLRDKWSCGVGGHVDRDTEGQSKDPLNDATERELNEEVKMINYPIPKIVGLVTIDNKGVEHYHVGAVAIAETEEDVQKGNDEMAECSFYSIEELERLFANPENDIELFTQLSWSFVKSFVKSM